MKGINKMSYDALQTILSSASPRTQNDVTFTGGADPLLPTPFRIGPAGAASLAATGAGRSRAMGTRTGRRQDISVDLRQATASLRSGHYLKLGDGDVPAARNPIMGVYPARYGRWSYIHANFPNHRAAALRSSACRGTAMP